jgi:hypothetical protein
MLVPPPDTKKPQDGNQSPKVEEPTNPRTCKIHLVRFTIPLLARAPSERRFWEPPWADAKSDQPPLSWHLREVEKREIEDAWKAFRDEAVGLVDEAAGKPPPGPSKDKPPGDPDAWPVDNVISFLKTAQSELPSTRTPATSPPQLAPDAPLR